MNKILIDNEKDLVAAFLKISKTNPKEHEPVQLDLGTLGYNDLYINKQMIMTFNNNLKPYGFFKNGKIIVFGDDDYDDVNALVSNISDAVISPLNIGTISWRCVARLIDPSIKTVTLKMSPKLVQKVIKEFMNGRLEIIDITLDITVRKKPSERGFTKIRSDTWHKPSTAIIKDNKTGKYFILGQDEGSYFGCEYPEDVVVTSVDDGFAKLMPEEVRNSKMPFQRQGEWFFFKVGKKEEKTLSNMPLHTFGSIRQIELPRETKDSNIHLLDAEDAFLMNAQLFIKGYFTCDHQQHEQIRSDGNGWYKVYRNTAVRSISEEGVD